MESPFTFTYPLSVAFIECNCVIIIMCEWVCVVSAPREHTWWCTYSCVCPCPPIKLFQFQEGAPHTIQMRYNVKYVEIGAHFEIIESQFGKRKIPQQKTAATWLRWCRRRGEKLLHIAMHRTISTEHVFGLDAFLHSILCISLVVSLSHLFSACTLQLLSLDFTALCQYIGMHALCRPNGIFGQS